MKKIVSSLVASIALVSTLNAADNVYATVDGDEITKKDIAIVLQDPRIDYDKLPDNAKKQVIEQIINIKLLSKKAIDDGIEKDKDYQEAMKKMKEDLAFQVWQKNEIDSIKITDEQKKDFYEKNKDKFVVPETLKARHILLKTEEEAKAVIKELDKASKKEEKFIELAKTKSVGPTGKNGGDLGEFAATQMVPEFATAASALTVNTYTKAPVKTQFGYHVIYLNDKKAGKSLGFNEVEAKITQILIGNTYNKKVKELTDDLRKSANIVIK